MDRWIKAISGRIPHTNKDVNIELDGKNLIITGANGTGKTSFLVEMQKQLRLHLLENSEPTMLSIPNIKSLVEMCKNTHAVVCYFAENREFKAMEARYAHSIEEEVENAKQSLQKKLFANDPVQRKMIEDGKPLPTSFALNFEQHLVNLKSRQSLAITMDKNQDLAAKIERWFADFENNLKILFEDDSIELQFNSGNFKFSLHQQNKPSFDFQHLSSGYRAIFDIYAELILHTEYFDIVPSDLTGIVLIDEVDAHLHVSLQRLILPFFAGSFPKIQFIVTTHSPFVLMSAPDTVVFDLAQNEPIREDLSYYTYSAVMKGLWNVKPISVNLENTVKEIAQLTTSANADRERLSELVSRIKGREDALDSESRAFYLLGLEALEEAGNV